MRRLVIYQILDSFILFLIIIMIIVFIDPFTNRYPYYYSDEIYYVSASRYLSNKLFGMKDECYTAIAPHVINDTDATIYYIYRNYPGIYACGAGVNSFDKYYGYPMPDIEYVIFNPLNIEHPFFYKLILAITIRFCDTPYCWRIPSFIFLITTFLIVYILLDKINILSISTMALLLVDGLFIKVGTTAMIDIAVCCLTMLTVLLITRRKYSYAILSSSIALGFKLTGIIPISMVITTYALEKRNLTKILKFTFTTTYISLATYALSYAIISLTLNIPLLETIAMGITLLLGIKECEGCSPPWSWLIRGNEFRAFPKGIPTLYLLSTILSLRSLKALKSPKNTTTETINLCLLSGLTTLFSIYLFRNTYGYYIVTLIPLMYTSLALSLNDIFQKIIDIVNNRKE